MAKKIAIGFGILAFAFICILMGGFFSTRASYTPMSGNLTPVSMTLNSAYQPSATNAMFLVYYVDATVISALAGNNSMTIAIQTSSTLGGVYTTLVSVIAQQSGVLSTTVQTQSISALIPVGMYVKLLTTSAGANVNTAVYRYGLEYPLP